MTSIACGQRPSRAPLVIIPAAFLFVLFLVAWYGTNKPRGGNIPQPVSMPAPKNVDLSRTHGDESHAVHAAKARQCLDNNNAMAVFKQKHHDYGFMWHLLCRGQDGKLYLRLVYKLKGVLYEETAYIFKDGLQTKWHQVWRYWSKKQGALVTDASQLPWK